MKLGRRTFVSSYQIYRQQRSWAMELITAVETKHKRCYWTLLLKSVAEDCFNKLLIKGF